jgi:hypothetical protein
MAQPQPEWLEGIVNKNAEAAKLNAEAQNNLAAAFQQLSSALGNLNLSPPLRRHEEVYDFKQSNSLEAIEYVPNTGNEADEEYRAYHDDPDDHKEPHPPISDTTISNTHPETEISKVHASPTFSWFAKANDQNRCRVRNTPRQLYITRSVILVIFGRDRNFKRFTPP